ncbi:hypothetical protein F5148DRAFT_1147102 [Russula earlei]|uniref:Uncharacterized protein n=1 Tax=Russula earlei TaxID=71964 RepID=A0ACC0UHA9_9AGAM|nr:hypothetical protein F5148DRAFT_1147102 [Russula earlei]
MTGGATAVERSRSYGLGQDPKGSYRTEAAFPRFYHIIVWLSDHSVEERSTSSLLAFHFVWTAQRGCVPANQIDMNRLWTQSRYPSTETLDVSTYVIGDESTLRNGYAIWIVTHDIGEVSYGLLTCLEAAINLDKSFKAVLFVGHLRVLLLTASPPIFTASPTSCPAISFETILEERNLHSLSGASVLGSEWRWVIRMKSAFNQPLFLYKEADVRITTTKSKLRGLHSDPWRMRALPPTGVVVFSTTCPRVTRQQALSFVRELVGRMQIHQHVRRCVGGQRAGTGSRETFQLTYHSSDSHLHGHKAGPWRRLRVRPVDELCTIVSEGWSVCGGGGTAGSPGWADAATVAKWVVSCAELVFWAYQGARYQMQYRWVAVQSTSCRKETESVKTLKGFRQEVTTVTWGELYKEAVDKWMTRSEFYRPRRGDEAAKARFLTAVDNACNIQSRVPEECGHNLFNSDPPPKLLPDYLRLCSRDPIHHG